MHWLLAIEKVKIYSIGGPQRRGDSALDFEVCQADSWGRKPFQVGRRV